jgi:hypothetical protein
LQIESFVGVYNSNPRINDYVTYDTVDKTVKDIEKERKFLEETLGKITFRKYSASF